MTPRPIWSICWICTLVGCTGPAFRTQSPEEPATAVNVKTKLVGGVTQASGTGYVMVEGTALVVGLSGTGEDPAPSPLRSSMLREMKTLDVDKPNQILASTSTAIVLVRGWLPPGVQKGDSFDLEFQIPRHSETTSLRGGWMMKTRMTELAVLGNQIHDGHLLAYGEGAAFVDPSANKDNNAALLTKGRILGGGTALKSRPFALSLLPDERSFRLSSLIGDAINRRFHVFSHGNKSGVATPKTDYFIELTVHPRYKDNVGRFMRVVRAVAIKESQSEQITRIAILKRQLRDPVMSANAALQLEAIGRGGVNALLGGLDHSSQEIQFYAAEALAYLDRDEAVQPLVELARTRPEFRAHALAALGAMDDVAAYDALRTLLDVPSAVTRYGAFRALWAMNARDAAIRGEELGDFSYHMLRSAGPPMVHATRSTRPEIVLFGDDHRLKTPFLLEAGQAIIVKSTAAGEVSVSNFGVGKADQRRVVSNDLDAVIRAIVEVGGTYPDVVQVLQQAKQARVLASRFEINALPAPSRIARGIKTQSTDKSAKRFKVTSPFPDLFSSKESRNNRR